MELDLKFWKHYQTYLANKPIIIHWKINNIFFLIFSNIKHLTMVICHNWWTADYFKYSGIYVTHEIVIVKISCSLIFTWFIYIPTSSILFEKDNVFIIREAVTTMKYNESNVIVK